MKLNATTYHAREKTRDALSGLSRRRFFEASAGINWFALQSLEMVPRAPSSSLQHSADPSGRTASLGEKRSVALIKIDELQFLIGGGPANVVLLAQVNASERFDEMLKGNLSEPQKQAAKRPYKPIVKPAVKPHVKPTAKLAIKPVLHPITRKPVKAATKPVGKQAVKQVRKQA